MKIKKALAQIILPKTRFARALLLLLLEVVLLASSITTTKVDVGQKAIDRYWLETGLEAKELEALLTSESCGQNLQNYLACVNSIGAMSERYNLALDFNGSLVTMTPDLIRRRLTEKSELLSWSQHIRTAGLVDLSFLKIWHKLDAERVSHAERASVIASGLNGFLSVTKDPHSYILPLSYYEEVISRSDSRSMNLGFISRRVPGGAFVRKVFEGSPAQLAGLKKGDQILEVAGIDVASLNPSQFSDLLKVRIGERLRLKLMRSEQNISRMIETEVFKTEAIFPNVTAKMIDEEKRVGMLTLHKFSRETCQQARAKLIGLKEEGLRGLIVDLRDNPGGQVDEAACVLNLFVSKGTLLFETRYLDISRPSEKYIAEKGRIYQGPLTILINGGSASAAEIVAGSLKDLGRATLVGEKSFGKGSFQDGRIWGANTKIALFETEGIYYFPSGWTPQLVGLEPDLLVSSVEGETLREEDLYFNSIRPQDIWAGPQGLAWINDLGCQSFGFSKLEDPQVDRAFHYLSCEERSSGHDQN